MSRDLLQELEDAGPHEPCMGIWAVAGLYHAGCEDHTVQANWAKLAGRPTGKVRNLLATLFTLRPELHQSRLTEFAKDVKRVKTP